MPGQERSHQRLRCPFRKITETKGWMTGNSFGDGLAGAAHVVRGASSLGSDELAVLKTVARHGSIGGTRQVGAAAFDGQNLSPDERMMRASRALTTLRDQRLVEWREDEGSAIVWMLAEGVNVARLAELFGRQWHGRD